MWTTHSAVLVGVFVCFCFVLLVLSFIWRLSFYCNDIVLQIVFFLFGQKVYWYVTFQFAHFSLLWSIHLNIIKYIHDSPGLGQQSYFQFFSIITGLLWAFLPGSSAKVQEFLQVIHAGIALEGWKLYVHLQSCYMLPTGSQNVWTNLHCP